ncbi:MAG: cytochrome C peroxidase [Desulfobacteraceae bacterium]|nr:cytochrome C peroxidase [Desulfobacteraceae bacterium]
MNRKHMGLIGLAMGLVLASGIPVSHPPFAWGREAPGRPHCARAAGERAGGSPPSDEILLLQAKSIFGHLPDKMPGSEQDTPVRIELGRMLYFEPGMSINRTQSCNSCHPLDLSHGGAENVPTSEGAMGKAGLRNAPTVLNAGFQIAQFWDGRAANLAEQAKGPILNPIEMGMPKPDLAVGRVRAMAKYQKLFPKAFPGEKNPITYDNIAEAIAAFERTLVTRGRFDRFLAGDTGALSGREKEGLAIFMNQGCIRCHGGPLLGGMLYQKIGIYHPYETKDLGRFEVTRAEGDKYVFKVPMLRNALLTAPYFHDGRVGTLPEAVDLMAWLQLDETLGQEQIDRIIRFLTAVVDEKRTTAPPPPGAGRQSWWNPPAPAAIPAGPEGDRIRRGYRLVTRTYQELGAPSGLQSPPAGSLLACRNCHQEAGTKQFGIPWVGVTGRYPRYLARTGKEVTLPGRINDCFERSLNGRALPEGGQDMQAIVAYMTWLGRKAPAQITGRGTLAFAPPAREANRGAGKEVYLVYCQGCHGMNGAGYRERSAGKAGENVVPPLWGEGSFNNGAGMARLLMAAAFVGGNMPLGTPWDRPVVSVDQAYDVGAYINGFDRPNMEDLDKDFPDRTQKPVDCPYPPYADDFPHKQHQYGPFQPIQAYYRNLREQKE